MRRSCKEVRQRGIIVGELIPVKHSPCAGIKDGKMPGGDDVAIPDPLIPLAYVATRTRLRLRGRIAIGRMDNAEARGNLMDAESAHYQSLATYRRCAERIAAAWPGFLAAREDRLRQQARHGTAAEKVAEAILEDLLTQVLDWNKGDLDYQVGYADIVLTQNFVKYAVLEMKHPGVLAWHRHAVEAALAQARRYADEQRVSRIAVSDGTILYAADIEHGVQKDRLFVNLARPEPPLSLWWLSVHGVYRAREGDDDRALIEEQVPSGAAKPVTSTAEGELLHPKYKLPARCFGYVGNAADPRTWKLPHLEADGAIDEKRLPKAIQAVISNYRGVRVGGIPEPAIPDVLVRLAQAAARAGKLPGQAGHPAAVYVLLVEVLGQMGRLNGVALGAKL